MGIITGGKIIGAGPGNPGVKPRIYYAEAVPTDTNLGYDGTPANGTLAVNVLTGNVYERTGVNIWTRVDTL